MKYNYIIIIKNNFYLVETDDERYKIHANKEGFFITDINPGIFNFLNTFIDENGSFSTRKVKTPKVHGVDYIKRNLYRLAL